MQSDKNLKSKKMDNPPVKQTKMVKGLTLEKKLGDKNGPKRKTKTR